MTRICIYMLSTILVISQALYACFDYRPQGAITCSENSSINVGESVTFTASNLDCTIVQYQWRLPSSAYCIVGENTSQIKCKFSPAGTYTVELLIKCIDDMWNVDPFDVDPITTGRITYTITVNPVTGPWYVRTDGSDDNSGLADSTAGAFRTIQTAIDSAIDEQEIIVKQGTYYEQVDFKGKNVNVHSENPSDSQVVANTIIDGNKQGTAVLFRGNESSNDGCGLNGFTVQGGFPAGDGLALSLKFDESTNCGFDASDKERDGTLFGPQWTNAGRSGGAINFDGVDDYIQIENYKGVLGRNSRTISAWIKPEGVGSPTICSWGSIEEGKRWMMTLDSNGGLALGVWGGRKYSNVNLRDGKWHHVVVSLDGESNPNITEVKLYVDGVEQTTALVDNCIGGREIFTETGDDVIIGARFEDEEDPDADYCYVGKIDEFRIYSRVLSVQEIRTLSEYPVSLVHLSFDGNANDSSGYGYNGTILDNPSPNWATGYQGQALTFDGVDDRVELDAGILDPSQTAFSVFAWVRLDVKNATSYQAIIQQMDVDAQHPGRTWLLRNTDNKLSTSIGNAAITSAQDVFSQVGQWHHVGLTYDGQIAKIYIDGQSAGSASRTAEACTGKILIGRQKTDTNTYWNGLIDEVFIIKRVLSDEEVFDLAQKNIQAYWKLDADINDASGHHRNGITFNDTNNSGTQWYNGCREQALYFDGVDDYISTNYNGILGSQDRTVCAWIKAIPDGSLFLRSIVSWGGTATGGAWNLAVNYVSGEGPSGTIRLAAGGSKVVGTTPVDDDRWHHVAAVFKNDGTPTVSDIQLYIDGKKETISYTFNADLNTGTGNNVAIGAAAGNPNASFYFKGKIDDVQIYGSAFNDEQIQSLASGELGLIGHWELEESTADSCYNHDGTLYNSEWVRGAVGLGLSSGSAGYVEVYDASEFNYSAAFTMSAWVKKDLSTFQTTKLIYRDDINSGYYLSCKSGSPAQWGFSSSVDSVQKEIDSTCGLRFNSWTHVVARRDENGLMELFVDGVRQDEINALAGTINSSASLKIGNSGITIDDVRMYKSYVADNQIRKLHLKRFVNGGNLRGYSDGDVIENCEVINRTLYVDDSAAANGTGTQSHPFQTIQAAINSACDGDTVVVMPGTYNESINYYTKPLTITSTTVDAPADTVIAGGSNNNVVTIMNQAGGESELIGFKIQGGAIYQSIIKCVNANVVISDCEIVLPEGSKAIEVSSADITVQNVLTYGTVYFPGGSGIYSNGNNKITVKDSEIKYCSYGAYSSGYIADQIIIAGCEIHHNNYGIYVWGENISLDCTLSKIYNNSQYGIYMNGDKATRLIENCCIYKNGNSGVYCYNTSPKVINCTFAKNCQNGGWAIEVYPYYYNSYPLIKNCIFSNNTQNSMTMDFRLMNDGYSYISYSCFQQQVTGAGPCNIHEYPGFVNLNADDYHLLSSSLAVDGGDPADGLTTTGGVIDMGMYGNTSEDINSTLSSAYDGDNDGIRDSWEKYYWPSDDPLTHLPGGDDDSGGADGVKNLAEYIFGYSPQGDNSSEPLALTVFHDGQMREINPAMAQTHSVRYIVNKSALVSVKVWRKKWISGVATVEEFTENQGQTMDGGSIGLTELDFINGATEKAYPTDFYHLKITAVPGQGNTVEWKSRPFNTTTNSGAARTLLTEEIAPTSDTYAMDPIRNIPLMFNLNVTSEWGQATLVATYTPDTGGSYPPETWYDQRLLKQGSSSFQWYGWKKPQGDNVKSLCFESMEFSVDAPYGYIYPGVYVVYYENPFSDFRCDPYRIIPSRGEFALLFYKQAYDAKVKINVYKPNGELYTILRDYTQVQVAGPKCISWNGVDSNGQLPVDKGTYRIEIIDKTTGDSIDGALTLY